MQLAVPPCQDEGILLQGGRWGGVTRQCQIRTGIGEVFVWARTGQGRALVTKGSDLGDEKQSVDLRHFQAGPGGGKAGSALGRQHLHPHVPSAHAALAYLYGG